MAKLTIQQLGQRLRKERGERGVREVAKEIGISAATLSRVERGNLPDLQTFAKMCDWLDLDPGDVLGTRGRAGKVTPEVTASAHFRANQTPSPELARALGDLIQYAQEKLRNEPPSEIPS